jgi:DUF1680 family protein
MNFLEIQAQFSSEKFNRLPVGSIKPTGWLKSQMEADMHGFVGNLDKLVPELINDPIYGNGRLQKHSKPKDLGNLKEGDAAGDEQYKWWNSETQSNWWDGYIRNAILLDDKLAIKNIENYIERVLETQDNDGYIGIYDKELRYKFTSENGELWSKATLYRGLLAFYEYSGSKKVWNALVRAVENVMQNYPIYNSNPFHAGLDFSGGVAHGLTFTDVLDRMYQLTGDKKYSDYALFLYFNYSENFSSEKDVQLKNILNPTYKLQSHGVHTYEHIRTLIVAAYASQNKELKNALNIYLQRINQSTTQTGGPIGDEWIAERTANATNTGYEYCSIHELLDSYTLLLQKTGDSKVANRIENIFYNAAQGSRNPNHSGIAYLKTDNSYEMLGTKNGEIEANREQTRYKYSPAHQDVAVCCNPNAGRITPYFVQSSWFSEGKNTLVAALLMPNILQTCITGNNVIIQNHTEYPFKNSFDFEIQLDKPTKLCIKIRKPNWVKSIVCSETYLIDNEYIVINRKFNRTDRIKLRFETDVKVEEDINHEKYYRYGALIYAKSIDSNQVKGKEYLSGFADYMYKPMQTLVQYKFAEGQKATFKNGKIKTYLLNTATNEVEGIQLVPFCKTILRQVSF